MFLIKKVFERFYSVGRDIVKIELNGYHYLILNGNHLHFQMLFTHMKDNAMSIKFDARK